MPFISVEKRENMRDGYFRVFKLHGKKVILIQDNNQVFAIEHTCPHDHASLVKGKVSDQCIRCPKHRIEFDLATGKALGGIAVEGISRLTRYEVIYQGDDIGLDWPDQ